MKNIKIITVEDDKQKEEFLNFAARLYSNDVNYIRPLDQDIECIFDNTKNNLFADGQCQRLLFEINNQTVGKVAVFINRSYHQKQPTGGIGFFDCINDQEIANYIFDYCKIWLQERGMEAMDGPVNFGERDKFWGLLVEGFTEPLYSMNYNFPYYKALFENYGFKSYFDQLCYSRRTDSEVSRVFKIMHKKHKLNPAIKAVALKKNNLKKYAKDFTAVYNKAWSSHGEGKYLAEKETIKMFETMKPIINEHISWFVYENDKPIAVWLNIPDLNQWLKYFNGKFGLVEKLKFLWLKNFRKNRTMAGLVFGVIPEWQKKGIEGYMICEGTEHLLKFTDFETIELQWIGDFNPKMIKIAESLDSVMTRKLTTYRYYFDEHKAFERHPVV